MKEDLLSQVKNNQEKHFIRLIYAFTPFFLHLFEKKKKLARTHYRILFREGSLFR